MRYSIDIDHGYKIIRYKHKGPLDLDDIGQAWEGLLKIREFTDLKYNLLTNYLDAKYVFDLNSIKEIIDHLRNLESILRGKKQAIITSDFYSVAANLLFQDKVYLEIGFIVQAFSTEKAAIDWLLD